MCDDPKPDQEPVKRDGPLPSPPPPPPPPLGDVPDAPTEQS